jgi:hypothetical protein
MSFIQELSWTDLQRLRHVVRRVHRKYFRDEPTLVEIDQLIESLGAEVAEAHIKVAVDRNLVG